MPQAKKAPDDDVVTPIKALQFGKVWPRGFKYQTRDCWVPAGTKPSDLLHPTYFKHYLREWKPHDKPEAFCEDGTWEATYRVLYIGDSKHEAHLSMIYEVWHDTSIEESLATDTHEVKWISPTKKFAVIRIDSGAVVQDGFYPKDHAVAYMHRHLRNITK